MKMMLGLCSLARLKRFRTSFSDSPSHFETRSALETEKKVELLASVATAFARYDLPVPGGPNCEKILIVLRQFVIVTFVGFFERHL